MRFSQFKILPLLIFVAMLAFSVRLVDVANGLSTLRGEAMAEEKAAEVKPAEAKHDEKKPDEAETAAKDEKPAEGAAPASPGAPPAVDAPEWVDSGDTDTEFSNVRHELYDNLATRRAELDKRETDMMTREALLRAAEQEIDRKYNELSQLRLEIEKLLQKQSDEEDSRISSLVKIYEGMKPKDAARIFDTLDIDVLITVMSKMSERKLSFILAEMNEERARTITIMLAQQKQLPQLPASN